MRLLEHHDGTGRQGLLDAGQVGEERNYLADLGDHARSR